MYNECMSKRVRIQITMEPWTHRLARQLAEKQALNVSRYIEQLILKANEESQQKEKSA